MLMASVSPAMMLVKASDGGRPSSFTADAEGYSCPFVQRSLPFGRRSRWLPGAPQMGQNP
jgi:hypothetical protein